MIVIGIDTGFAWVGWCVVRLSRKRERFVEGGLIRTDKSDKKLNIKVAADDFRRTREIASVLCEIEYWDEAVAIAVEGQSWPQNSMVCRNIGTTWGIIAALAHQNQLPIVQSPPMDVKLAATGKRTATKFEVADAMCARRGFGKLRPCLDQWARGQQEHTADAAASVIAALDSDVIRAARRML